MSASTVKLLQAACEIVGGEKALAKHLGISETLLAKFLDDVIELPDRLLLQAADIILAERQERPRLMQNSVREAGQALGPGDD